MLREGPPRPALTLRPLIADLNLLLDGIHIDMDHLKKGEVKYLPLIPPPPLANPANPPSQSRNLNVSLPPPNSHPPILPPQSPLS